MRRGSGLAALCSILVIPSVAQAESDTRFSADASASVGYSHNPFAETGSGLGSGFIEASILPKAEIRNERSIFTLSGNVQHEEYSHRYSSSTDYGAALDYSGTPTERITTHGRMSYDSSIIGSLDDAVGGATGPSNPLPPTSGTDIGLFGSRDRVRTLNAQADATETLSSRDKISGSLFFVDTRYKKFGAQGDYDGYGGALGYSRKLSDHIEAGVQAASAFYDYKRSQGDTKVSSVQATLSAKFNAQWSLKGAVGVSFTDSDSSDHRKTSLSGNASLCRTGERSELCLTVNRAVLPTGIQGTQNTTSGGATYRYQVSEHGHLSAEASYVRNSGGSTVSSINYRYLRTTLSYDHELSKRLRLTSSLRYRDIFGGTVGRPSDFGGQIGLAYRLGDYR